MNGSDLADHIRATYRQVDYWTTCGYIAIKEANPGSGNERHYAPQEVRVAEVMAWLVRDGLTPKVAARVARGLVTRGKAQLGGRFMVTKRSAA